MDSSKHFETAIFQRWVDYFKVRNLMAEARVAMAVLSSQSAIVLAIELADLRSQFTEAVNGMARMTERRAHAIRYRTKVTGRYEKCVKFDEHQMQTVKITN